MDYLIDLKKQNLSGKTALEGGISLGVDTDGNIKKIDESGAISDIGGSVDESRLLPETGSVSSDSVGNPVIFKAISRIDNTYWLCLPLNEDTNDRSTYDVATGVYGTVNIVSNAPSSPGGSAFFNGSSCLYGTLPAQFGTSDFTVRLWMMAPAISSGSSSHTIFSTRRGNQTDADTFALLCTTEGRLYIYSDGNITSYGTDTPFALQSGVWYHVAVVRKSGVLTIYVNGEVYNSATFTNSLTRQIFGLGASWTGSSYSEAGTVYLTSLDVLNYAAYDGAFTTPAYQPGILAGAGYEVATDSELKDMLSAAGIDESRLLPELATIPEELSGHPVVYDYQSGIDADTLCLLHLDDSTWADATGKNTITQHGNVAKVSDSGYFSKALDLSGNQSSGSLSWLTVPWLAEYEAATWTMEFFAKPTKSVVNFMFFSFGNSQGSYLSLGSQSLTNLWLGNGSGTYTGNFSFSLNTWYWFVIQYDGSAVKVYVDGQLVVQGNFTPNYVGQDLQFGNLNLVNNQDNTFIGYLDEFRWSKGLRYPTGVMTAPTEPYGTPAKRYKVSEASLVFSDSTRLLPENPANGDIPCFDATATVGGGNDANTRILLHFDADEIKDEAAGNAAPVTITKKTGTITVVEGGKWGKCAKYVTGSMTVATNLDELNANNWVVSGWFNPDENNHGVSYPTWLSMDDSSTNGFMFDSTGRYGESDGPLFYLDTPPAAGTWHWLAIVKYSGGLRFYLNGAFLNEISAQQRANFCSTLAIGGFAGTYAAGSTERTFSGLVDEVRLQYIPDDEITQWTGTSIAVPDAPYSKPQTVGEWGKLNKSELAMKSELTGKVNQSELAAYQKKSEAFSGQYSDLAGKPSTFPPAAHTHTIANVTDLQATVNKAHEHTNKAALDKISETGGKLAYGGTAVGGVSSWTELADKPSTFPPAAHSHTIANVTDLQTMLNSKAASVHGHAVADVTGLQSLLDGKAAVGHTHAAADVTGLATTLAGKVSSVNGLTPDDSGALVLPQATSGAAGLMAAADKLKLDTFTNYTEKSGTENSGYIRFPGGLIMQFGSKEVLTPEAFVSGSIVFPRSFVDKPLSVTASVEIDNLTNAPFAISLYAPNTISVVFSGPIVGLPDTLEKIVLHWMAIGIENKPPTNSDNV